MVQYTINNQLIVDYYPFTNNPTLLFITCMGNPNFVYVKATDRGCWAEVYVPNPTGTIYVVVPKEMVQPEPDPEHPGD